MIINTNVSSITAQEAATNTGKSISSSLEKLSTGLKINKASDDASGLAIADKLRTQGTSIDQGVANGNSAVTLLQIADKSMAEQSNILDTVKAKLIQANTDTTSSDGREAIRKDIAKLLEQLDNIAEQTNYNGNVLLQASAGSTEADKYGSGDLSFQIGESENDIIGNTAIQSNTDGLGLAEKEENLVTLSAVNSFQYDLKVDGQTVSYTSDSSATLDEVHAGLKAAIEANSVLASTVKVEDQKFSGDSGLVISGNKSGNELNIAATTGTATAIAPAATTAAVAGVAQDWTTGNVADMTTVGDSTSITVGGQTITSTYAATTNDSTAETQADLIAQFEANEELNANFTIAVDGNGLQIVERDANIAATTITATQTVGGTAGAINGAANTAGVTGVAEVETATITAANAAGTLYELSIGGENISYTSTASETAASVAGKLQTAFEANENLSGEFSISVTGAAFEVTNNTKGEVFTTNVQTTVLSANASNEVTQTAGDGVALSALKDLAVGGLTKADADSFQDVVDAAITDLNGYRGDIGSTQNQVESAVRNLMTQSTNVKAAESIIRDVDYAAESANFNKQNIISQAGSYAISQANSVQQNVLKLLQ
jgi:flagellin